MAKYTFTMHMLLDWTVEAESRNAAVEKWEDTELEQMLAYGDYGEITNLEFDDEVGNDLVREDGRDLLDNEHTDANDNTVEWDEETGSYKIVKVQPDLRCAITPAPQ